MIFIAQLRSLAEGLLRRRRIESSMQDEMRFHIEAYTEDLTRSGVPQPEAERRARIEFGGVEVMRDECRQARGLRWFDDLRGDLRYGTRMLRRNPAFATVAVLSLGLGIGANTAVFSLINTVLLQSLPVLQPQKLFLVDDSGGRSGGTNTPPYPCYETLRDHNQFFSGIAAFGSNDLFKVTIDGTPEQIRGQYASGNYFEVLGVPALHGRVLTPSDDSQIGRGGPDGAAAVISYGLWKRRFGMSPSVLGKTMQVGTQWVTIVGVTPPEFLGLETGSPIDVTIPMMLYGDRLRDKQTWWFSSVGRLKDGASLEAARADLDRMFQAYMADIGAKSDLRKYFDRIVLVPADRGFSGLRRRFSTPLLIIMVIVGMVLLIGCANVANLLSARATARQNEIAVRLAIGAGRGRLVRQMLTEGMLLVAIGAALGVLFAGWGVTVLVSFFAGVRNKILLDPHFDWRVLAFTAALSVLTGLLFSIAPALRATRVDAAKPAGSGRNSTTKPRLRMGQALVVLQVMLSVVLLCGAALFVLTLRNLNAVDAGYYREGVLTMRVDATVPRPATKEWNEAVAKAEHLRIALMWEDLVARVSALPGVTSAGVAMLSPLSGRDRGVNILPSGGGSVSERDRGIHLNHVTPGYFDTVGIGLLAGRLFSPQDRPNSPRVAILNDTAARYYFPDANPVGRKVTFPGQRNTDEYEIVGVVRNAKYESVRKPDERMVYLPVAQPLERITGIMLAVRSTLDARSLVPAIRRGVGVAVPEGFVTNVATIREQVDESLVRERLVSILASFFGALALVLASIGLYGVMSYGVVRRTREIGIRIAIGAARQSVIWLVLRETLVLIALGVVLGIPAVLVAARYIDNELFGLAPGDPAAILSAVLLLLAVAVTAGYVPARRASRVDPMVALRYE